MAGASSPGSGADGHRDAPGRDLPPREEDVGAVGVGHEGGGDVPVAQVLDDADDLGGHAVVGPEADHLPHRPLSRVDPSGHGVGDDDDARGVLYVALVQEPSVQEPDVQRLEVVGGDGVTVDPDPVLGSFTLTEHVDAR